MNAPRLKSITVENFRSLRGRIVIPLDAQVVLIHGTNGMGKTSVLSALELALTGTVAHLAAKGNGFRRYLTTFGTPAGTAAVETTGPLSTGSRTHGSVEFTPEKIKTRRLLESRDAKFFSERCYLPQATLGQLLELYSDHKTNVTSPLTQFVKDLLGLEPLDALIDGLYPAHDVRRIRTLVPDYHQFETVSAQLTRELASTVEQLAVLSKDVDSELGDLKGTLAGIWPDSLPLAPTKESLNLIQQTLEADRTGENAMTAASRSRSEMNGFLERWTMLPPEATSHDIAEKERLESTAAQRFEEWRKDYGATLSNVCDRVWEHFPSSSNLDETFENRRARAKSQALQESKRCTTLLQASAAASQRLSGLQTTIERAQLRIRDLTAKLSSGAQNAKSLASSLSQISPHVNGETCPVCDRDFAEIAQTSLAAHLSDKISALTNQAAQMQVMAAERASETSRLATAERDLLSVGAAILPGDQLATLTLRASQLGSAAAELEALSEAASAGDKLNSQLALAREAVAISRQRTEVTSTLLPEIGRAVQSITKRPVSSYGGVEDAIREAILILESELQAAERLVSLRFRAFSQSTSAVRLLESIAATEVRKKRLAERLVEMQVATSKITAIRYSAKVISDSAARVRASIATKVFNTSLNRVWRDLFIRLAPSEQFVPSFKLPSSHSTAVEAILETVHRTGLSSGAPGAMLSQGNLNTAALTLFLALHLTAPARIPWLVLDDPVQSMDDVHIAQFAALLRTISKQMGLQIIVAVHERALFDYLTLELSPAFLGDSLISAVIQRDIHGHSAVEYRAHEYRRDPAIAA